MLKTLFLERSSQKGSSLREPFYNPNISYEENYERGPFGVFADGQVFKQEGEPRFNFLSQKVYLPFGIPAGPLLNADFCKAAFEKGFDICVYKTVRSQSFPSHPFPNVLAVKIKGDLTIEKAKDGKLVADADYSEPISITNSFGVPSKDPAVWQEDVKKAVSYAGKGQVLVLSFMGTVKTGQTKEEFIEDYRVAARKAYETGAKVLEVNLSCPNIGNEGLVCYDLKMTEKLAQAIRGEIGSTPLILKVGYYQNNQDIEKLVEVAKKYAQAIAAINTIQTEVINKEGNQALPGPKRARSGVCGAAIKWAGLEMAQRLKKIKEEKGADLSIIGIGGVTKAKDYFEFKSAGADCVMSATGAMWNPELAQEVKRLDK